MQYNIETITVELIYSSPEKYQFSICIIEELSTNQPLLTATSSEEVRNFDYGHKLKFDQSYVSWLAEQLEVSYAWNQVDGFAKNKRVWRI